MQEPNFDEGLDRILAHDARYAREAYLFLRDALDHTQQELARKSRGQVQHVNGRELLLGLKDYALAEFGPLTMTVFDEWGVQCGEDFGRIVFNLVDAGLLAKTPEDSLADFAGVFDFDEAFRRPFLPPSRQAANQRRANPAGAGT